jgi:hypothetical protein
MSAPLGPLPEGFGATVASLHRVAEALVAPARKPDNEIALEATPGGFGTPEFEFDGARQRVRVEGAELVREVDGEERRAPLGSLAEAGAVIADLLPPGQLSAEPLDVDPAASLALGVWYELGASLLGELVAAAAPADAATPPRLWPEHFDIAIELGSEADGLRANYGLSPGDETHAEPYVYVGPWSAPVAGDLWQAQGFSGAELSYAELLAAADPHRRVSEFFTSRRDDLPNFRPNEGTP